MRRIGVEERRARLGRRHHLAAGAGTDPTSVARDVVALHSTDPSSVYLAVAARMRDAEVAAIERALYEERTLIRMLGMRRTVFVVPVELAAVVKESSTRAVAARLRRGLVQHLAEAGATGDADPGEWLAELEAATHRALQARGEAMATELAEDVPGLRTTLLLAEGKKYQAEVRINNRVLGLMAADGLIVRGRPRGSWISSQYRWSPIEAWLPAGLPAWSTADAQVELVRRWLAAYGPGTAADLKWWTGWTAGEVKRALAAIGPAEVELDGGGTGYVLPDDLGPVEPTGPWVALLPALDPTVMGWAGRDWYLGDHGPALFDGSGNPGPTVWVDGRIAGGWAQRADGEVVYRLLEDVGSEAGAAVAAAAARLEKWMGEVRVVPRFRTPLERELTS
ncbi:MAG: winged helix DNA-binding domain-containing protein [Mycobacteriales bacterium]